MIFFTGSDLKSSINSLAVCGLFQSTSFEERRRQLAEVFKGLKQRAQSSILNLIARCLF